MSRNRKSICSNNPKSGFEKGIEVEQRRRNMQAIRGRDTRLEIVVRKALYQRGFRYRIAPVGIPGKPDIWMGKHRAAVFINGCFWHAHGCHLFTLPRTRRAFWAEKLNGNVIRDRKNLAALHRLGIRVLVIWECALKGHARLPEGTTARLVETWIISGSKAGIIDSGGMICLNETENDRMTGILTTV
ncbi:DNA mismatch endonuclease Vsr [Shewanella sp. JM162201]|uniref:DNA mismatch endonuclease Vsr n=1 Tax=Shewanella jiangmenensis TaxID=2837387 RepID=A0ABS5V7E0_9GAMM|nr:DNA mismatch endonuclease Vsr [Shewanella jiangmenensis]